jgi:hypothetical protein
MPLNSAVSGGGAISNRVVAGLLPAVVADRGGTKDLGGGVPRQHIVAVLRASAICGGSGRGPGEIGGIA